MEVFLDTSAAYALLVEADEQHSSARATLEVLREGAADLVTTSYVANETVALLQRRWGLEAVRDWSSRVEPNVRIVWMDEEIHRHAMTALLASESREISLTDWASFEVIRREGIRRVFAFDRHFRNRGFEVIP